MRWHALLPATLMLALVAGCDDVPDLSLPNQPPQANDDVVALLQDNVTDIDIGANDIDIDGNLVSIEIIDEPANGTISDTIVSAVRYTPNRLFTGTDSFTYRITDALGESDTATVNITVRARQTRAIFKTTDAAGTSRLYLLDSRAPDGNADTDVLYELSLNLDGESVKSWVHNSLDQSVIILTDGDRLVAVPLSDPENPDAIVSLDIPLEAGETVDQGLAIALNTGLVAYSVNHRYVRILDLSDATFSSFDTGWTTGTMDVSGFSTTGTTTVMSGTLGDPAVSALYLANVTTDSSTVALQEASDASDTLRPRILADSNSLVWVLGESNSTNNTGFDCQQPPPQNLSDLFYVPLLNVQAGSIVNLNDTSGLLGNGTSLIGYFIAETGARVFVAACPAGSDVVQLVSIAFASASTAAVVASLENLFYEVDVSRDGSNLIYVQGNDVDAEPIFIQLSDADSPTSLASYVPQYTLYDDNGSPRAPASALSDDNRRWLFIAAPSGSPTELTWLELGGLSSDPIDADALTTSASTLGFAAMGEPVSDGYHAFVSATANDQTSVSLTAPGETATVFSVPGTINRSNDPLGSRMVLLLPVPLDETP